jgi:hypothetical protein
MKTNGSLFLCNRHLKMQHLKSIAVSFFQPHTIPPEFVCTRSHTYAVVIPVATQTGIHCPYPRNGARMDPLARRTGIHTAKPDLLRVDPGLRGNRDDGARGGAVPKQLALIATRTGPRKRA